MRTTRCFKSSFVVFLKHEGVVPVRVRPELRTIMEWAKRQRCATAPTTHHLGCQQFLFIGSARIRLEKAAEVSDSLIKLSKDDVRAIASEDLRCSLLHTTEFIAVAEHEFSG